MWEGLEDGCGLLSRASGVPIYHLGIHRFHNWPSRQRPSHCRTAATTATSQRTTRAAKAAQIFVTAHHRSRRGQRKRWSKTAAAGTKRGTRSMTADRRICWERRRPRRGLGAGVVSAGATAAAAANPTVRLRQKRGNDSGGATSAATATTPQRITIIVHRGGGGRGGGWWQCPLIGPHCGGTNPRTGGQSRGCGRHMVARRAIRATGPAGSRTRAISATAAGIRNLLVDGGEVASGSGPTASGWGGSRLRHAPVGGAALSITVRTCQQKKFISKNEISVACNSKYCNGKPKTVGRHRQKTITYVNKPPIPT